MVELIKEAQQIASSGQSMYDEGGSGLGLPYTSPDRSFDDDDADVEVPYDDFDDGDQVELEFDDNPDEMIVFTLPPIPGASDDSEIEVEPDDSLEVSPDEENHEVEVEEQNPWDWQSRGLPNFLQWVAEMMHSVPEHTGRDTTGLERAVAYFEALDKEITKAMRMDFKNEIHSAKAEEARAEIEDGLERLVERLERVRSTKYKRHAKKSKKADVYYDETTGAFVKEAGGKSTQINGIVITVPIFISRIARACINSMVSAGHDIEDTFEKLAKRWKLTDREQMEVIQLLDDMGYMHSSSRDRGLGIDDDFDPTSSDNVDFAANYPG